MTLTERQRIEALCRRLGVPTPTTDTSIYAWPLAIIEALVGRIEELEAKVAAPLYVFNANNFPDSGAAIVPPMTDVATGIGALNIESAKLMPPTTYNFKIPRETVELEIIGEKIFSRVLGFSYAEALKELGIEVVAWMPGGEHFRPILAAYADTVPAELPDWLRKKFRAGTAA